MRHYRCGRGLVARELNTRETRSQAVFVFLLKFISSVSMLVLFAGQITLLILLKKSFRRNDEKIFRSQMPYN